jgi:hypothetical protein
MQITAKQLQRMTKGSPNAASRQFVLVVKAASKDLRVLRRGE